MSEVGRHIDWVDNDFSSMRQRILFRFVLAENGIMPIVTDSNFQTLADRLIKATFTSPEVEVGEITVDSNPELWLNHFIEKYSGDYQFATTIHGPDCPYGEIGDTVSMQPRKI